MATTSATMRAAHRYLGFFLAGIMAVYALSGVVLIFRSTDFLKREVVKERTIAKELSPEEAGKVLRIKDLAVDSTAGSRIFFRGGNYDSATGVAVVTTKELPYVLDKMNGLHKANTKDPLFYFNIFFGLALLFFVVSAFYMFTPGSTILRKGLLFSAIGVVLTLILLFV